MPLPVFYSDAMLAHDPGPGHPECAERLRTVCAALRESGLDLDWPMPRPASRDDVLRVHTAAHIDLIDGLRGRSAAIDPDTRLSPGSVEAAWLSCGAAIDAVEHVLDAPAGDRRAFALCRPPGHHAEPDRAMGFCLFNNIAIAAERALRNEVVERVMIVDFDVHHGNGTQAAFFDRDDVLYFSSHESPLFPGTGAAAESGIGAGAGATINVPLPAGCGDDVFIDLYGQVMPELGEQFRPDLVLVSAGFDAHHRDPIGGMRMTAGGFGRLTEKARGVADRHAAGRLVLVLEGGYDLEALGESVVACCRVMLEGTEGQRD